MTILLLVIAGNNAKADFVFGTPTNLGRTVSWPGHEMSPSVSADGLELYFRSNRSGGYGDDDIWVTTRPTIDDAWGQPTNLGPQVNSSSWEGSPTLSADGLSLYFSSSRPNDGYGESDIWVIRRASRNDDWGTPVNLGPTVNSSADDGSPDISFDGLVLFFSSERPGGRGNADQWMTMRRSVSDPWEWPVHLGPAINGHSYDGSPCISSDGLVLFFTSGGIGIGRTGGQGVLDIWMSKRATADADWDVPVNLGPTVNSPVWDGGPEISADGRTLYFHTGRVDPVGYGNGIYDLWQVPVEPIVDFNGDFQIDMEDLILLIEHWGADDPACDVGPMPWGDGVIDAADLEALMAYYGQNVDPNCLAHWKLDESSGTVAKDCAYMHGQRDDATVVGDPVWLPSGGSMDGALQLDGADDYLSTPFILDPGGASLSVFAWVKGGLPGQAIISQPNGSNRLMADAEQGHLATEFKAFTGQTYPFSSEVVITDGDWHRVGAVSDGNQRKLYVDGIQVKRKRGLRFSASQKGLHIGAGKDLAAGSFWSGLIDDVRVYNRVVAP